MLDLESSINIMPALVYYEFLSHILYPTDIIVQLANLSLVRPLGLVKDVVVKIDGLPFPTDFNMVNVNTFTPPSQLFVLLGRSFLEMVKVAIDVDKGSLRIKQGRQSQTFVMINDNSTTNSACFSFVVFQDSSPPPKLEVKDVCSDPNGDHG